jgi:hypothetical protein
MTWFSTRSTIWWISASSMVFAIHFSLWPKW